MAHSFVEANRIPLGQRLILTALHSQQARFPLPAEMPDQAELFSIPVIVILFDLLFASGKYNQALLETKKAVRWLQGRHDQVRWAQKEDDSEFDVAGYKRGPHAEPAPGYPLDINVRQRLGLVRLKLKQPDEARVRHGLASSASLPLLTLALHLQRHFEFIRALDPATYMVFWSEVAAAFLEARLYDDAIVYYEALAEITVRVPTSARDATTWLTQIAPPPHRAILTTSRAAETASELRTIWRVRANRTSLVRLLGELVCLARSQLTLRHHSFRPTASAAFEGDDESLSRVQLKLAAVYEPLGRRKEALDLVTGGASEAFDARPLTKRTADRPLLLPIQSARATAEEAETGRAR
jgi:tetratricopeptide (TPR) repeat protein